MNIFKVSTLAINVRYVCSGWLHLFSNGGSTLLKYRVSHNNFDFIRKSVSECEWLTSWRKIISATALPVLTMIIFQWHKCEYTFRWFNILKKENDVWNFIYNHSGVVWVLLSTGFEPKLLKYQIILIFLQLVHFTSGYCCSRDRVESMQLPYHQLTK